MKKEQNPDKIHNPTYEELAAELEALKASLGEPLPEDVMAYDSAWRTTINDARQLLIPFVNEVFGEHFSEKATVELMPNEHFHRLKGGETRRQITDDSFRITEAEENRTDGQQYRKHFLAECESSPSNNRILIRLFEYMTQIAIDQERETLEEMLVVKIPKAAVLFLRSNSATKDQMSIRLETENGKLDIPVQCVKMSDYTLDDLFDKKLYILMPFYLFNYEKQFEEIEQDEEKKTELLNEFLQLKKRLEELVPGTEPTEEDPKPLENENIMDTFTLELILDMAKKLQQSWQQNIRRSGKEWKTCLEDRYWIMQRSGSKWKAYNKVYRSYYCCSEIGK